MAQVLVVSDTSPIRALHHLGLVPFLDSLYTGVLVPNAVAAELARGGPKNSPLDVRQYRFIEVRGVADRTLVDDLRALLDEGEAEALALAVESRIENVLIDEIAGRTEAVRRGLTPVGTIGVLLEAKRRARVLCISPLIRRLVSETGFFVSDRLLHEVLRTAGETDERDEETA